MCAEAGNTSRNQNPNVLQEREADLSMEDLVQQHYEEPDDQELDEEVCVYVCDSVLLSVCTQKHTRVDVSVPASLHMSMRL